MLLLAVLGKFGALFASLPGAVVAGLFCCVFGLIAAVRAREGGRGREREREGEGASEEERKRGKGSARPAPPALPAAVAL